MATPEETHEEKIKRIFELFYEPVDAQCTVWRNTLTGNTVRVQSSDNKLDGGTL